VIGHVELAGASRAQLQPAAHAVAGDHGLEHAWQACESRCQDEGASIHSKVGCHCGHAGDVVAVEEAVVQRVDEDASLILQH
jgi:hypothetical protein